MQCQNWMIPCKCEDVHFSTFFERIQFVSIKMTKFNLRVYQVFSWKNDHKCLFFANKNIKPLVPNHFFHPRFLVSRLAAIEFSGPQWSMIRTTPSIRNVRWARPHEGWSMEGPSIEMVGKSTEDRASKIKWRGFWCDADSFVFKWGLF